MPFSEKLSKEQKAVESAVRHHKQRNIIAFPADQDSAKREHFDVIVCNGDSHKSGYCDCVLDRIIFSLCQEHKISAEERDNLSGGV